MKILALNAGSATLKYKLFQMSPKSELPFVEEVLTEGSADHAQGDGIVEATEKVIAACENEVVDAIAHRVVHGGARFTVPTRVTPEVMDGLRDLHDLDPLHNPVEIAMIEAGRRLLPKAPAVAVFDTAFHRTLPEVSWRYALPRDVSDKLQLRRYGFHGLSHQYVSRCLLQCLGRNPKGSRLIICHLGSGASVCAVRDGRSIDTSMGLTPLEGLVMGTRSGDIDPGLLLYLFRSANMTTEEVDDLLNNRSGLLGLSGTSGDVRELEHTAQSGDGNAELALEVFAYRVCKYIGAYAAALEGVDAVAFTGGIGERSPAMRTRICRRLAYLGLSIDSTRNELASGTPTHISADNSSVQAWMIPTDEERQIARETRNILGG